MFWSYRCLHVQHCVTREAVAGVSMCNCICEAENLFKRTCAVNTADFPWNYKAQRHRYCICCMTRQTDCKPRPWVVTDRRMDFKTPALTVARHSCKTLSVFWVCFSLTVLFVATIKVWSVFAIAKCVLWLQWDHIRRWWSRAVIQADHEPYDTSCMSTSATSHHSTAGRTPPCCSLRH